MGALRGTATGLVDDGFVVRWASPSFERMFGHDPTDESALGFLHPEDLTFALSTLTGQATTVRREGVDEIAPPTVQMRVRHRDGRWLLSTLSIEDRRDDPEIGAIVIRLERQADRSAMGRALDLIANDGPLEDVVRTVLEYISADSNQTVDEELFVRWTDGDREHLLGTRRQLPDSHPLVDRGLAAVALAGGTAWKTEAIPDERIRAAAADHGYATAWVLPITDADGTRLGVVMLWSSSGTELELRPELHLGIGCHMLRIALVESARRRAMRLAAMTDPLTGVWNRTGLTAQLQLAAANGTLPLAAVFVDLDEFKQINDTLGHDAGDHVLATTARRLVALAGHDSVARIGGDEFVVLHRLGGSDGLDHLVRQLGHAVALPIQVGSRQARIGASLGTAVARTHPELDDLVRRADSELYRVKHTRRRDPMPSLLGS